MQALRPTFRRARALGWKFVRHQFCHPPGLSKIRWRWWAGVVAGVIVLSWLSGLGSGFARGLEHFVNPDRLIGARVLVGAEPDDRLPVTIVDIDDATFHKWHEPVAIPRPQLFALINTAARGRPLAIIVDVDLTAASSVGELKLAQDLLEAYEKNSNEPRPPLILMRRLWYADESSERRQPSTVSVPTYRSFPDENSGEPIATEVLAKRLEELEGTVQRSPAMLWASPLHVLDHDGILRHWRSAEALCNPAPGAQRRSFLSPAAIVAALASTQGSKDPAEKVRHIKDLSQKYADAACGAGTGADRLALAPDVQLSMARNERLIPYTFWRERTSSTMSELGKDATNNPVPALFILSASSIGDGGEKGATTSHGPVSCDPAARKATASPSGISCDAMRDRVILIGASHVDSRDSYITPLGQMFGEDVIANEVLGARRIGAAQDFSRHLPMLGGAILMLVFAIVVRFWGAWTTVVFTTSTLLLFICLSGSVLKMDAAAGYEAAALSLIMFGAVILIGELIVLLQRLQAPPGKSNRDHVLSGPDDRVPEMGDG